MLRAGGLAIYPTETFYALGCRADKPEAVKAIYKIKRRKSFKPLPLLAASLQQAALAVNASLVDAFDLRELWPGPLTLVLPGLLLGTPGLVNPDGETAIRISACALARQLARLAGFPIVSSSANFSGVLPGRKFGQLDPLFIQTVLNFGLDAAILVSDGSSASDAPSTVCRPVLNGQDRVLQILRPGAVKRDALVAAGFTVDAK